MRGLIQIGGTLLVLIVVAGCGKEEGTAQEQIDAMSDQASDAAQTASDGAAGMLDKAKEGAAGMVDKVKDKAPEMIEAAKDRAGEAAAKARSMLDIAMENIKDKRFDLAQGVLDKRDRMKGSLPEALQEKISQVRTTLDVAKTKDQAESAADDVGDAVDAVKKSLPGLLK